MRDMNNMISIWKAKYSMCYHSPSLYKAPEVQWWMTITEHCLYHAELSLQNR